jgi:hypothetical protein
MPCIQCGEEPCSCQRDLKAVKPADLWHTRPCPNGDAMIREKVGQRGHEYCKWCQARMAKEDDATRQALVLRDGGG